jgi:hypothetical protein
MKCGGHEVGFTVLDLVVDTDDVVDGDVLVVLDVDVDGLVVLDVILFGLDGDVDGNIVVDVTGAAVNVELIVDAIVDDIVDVSVDVVVTVVVGLGVVVLTQLQIDKSNSKPFSHFSNGQMQSQVSGSSVKLPFEHDN